MTKRHPDNERIKRRYVLYLKDAKGRDEASIDAATAAIERFEEYNRRRDFKAFHIEQARGFKAQLVAARNSKTGRPLPASTVCSMLGAVKAFFVWLADQPGYASKIRYADADYFNPPDNLLRTAGAQRYVEFPTLAQVRAMLDAMPVETEVQKRDRALVAFATLTGARDRAICLVFSEARRSGTGRRNARCAGGPHEAGEDFHDMVFPRRGGYPANPRRLDRVPSRRKAVPGLTIPCSPSPRSNSTIMRSTGRCQLIARPGPTRTGCGRFSATRALGRGCATTIRIRSGRPWCNSPTISASGPRPSKLGRRTLATTAA